MKFSLPTFIHLTHISSTYTQKNQQVNNSNHSPDCSAPSQVPPLAIPSNSEAPADSDQEIRSHSWGEGGDNVKVGREDVIAEIGQRASPEVGDLMLCPGRMYPIISED